MAQLKIPHSTSTLKPGFNPDSVPRHAKQSRFVISEDQESVMNTYSDPYVSYGSAPQLELIEQSFGMVLADTVLDFKTNKLFYFEIEITDAEAYPENSVDEWSARVGLADIGILNDRRINVYALGDKQFDQGLVSVGYDSRTNSVYSNGSVANTTFDVPGFYKGDVIQFLVDASTNQVLIAKNGYDSGYSTILEDGALTTGLLAPAVTLPPGWGARLRMAKEDLLYAPFEYFSGRSVSYFEPADNVVAIKNIAVTGFATSSSPSDAFIGSWGFLDAQGNVFDYGTLVTSGSQVSVFDNLTVSLSDGWVSDQYAGYSAEDVLYNGGGEGFYTVTREIDITDGLRFTFANPTILSDAFYLERLGALHHDGGFNFVSVTENGKIVTAKRVTGGQDTQGGNFQYIGMVNNWYNTRKATQGDSVLGDDVNKLDSGWPYDADNELYRNQIRRNRLSYNESNVFTAKYMVIGVEKPFYVEDVTRNGSSSAVQRARSLANAWHAAEWENRRQAEEARLQAEWQIAKDAYDANPSTNPNPGPMPTIPSVNDVPELKPTWEETNDAGHYWWNFYNSGAVLGEITFYDKNGDPIPYTISLIESALDDPNSTGFTQKLPGKFPNFLGSPLAYGYKGNPLAAGGSSIPRDSNNYLKTGPWVGPNIHDGFMEPTDSLNAAMLSRRAYYQEQYLYPGYFVIEFKTDDPVEVHAIRARAGFYDDFSHPRTGVPRGVQFYRIPAGDVLEDGLNGYAMNPVYDGYMKNLTRSNATGSWGDYNFVGRRWFNMERVWRCEFGIERSTQFHGAVLETDARLKFGTQRYKLDEPSYMQIVWNAEDEYHAPVNIENIATGEVWTTADKADPTFKHVGGDTWLMPVLLPAGTYEFSMSKDFDYDVDSRLESILVYETNDMVIESLGAGKGVTRRVMHLANNEASSLYVTDLTTGLGVPAGTKTLDGSVYPWTPGELANRSSMAMSAFGLTDVLDEYTVVLKLDTAVGATVNVRDFMQVGKSNQTKFDIEGTGSELEEWVAKFSNDATNARSNRLFGGTDLRVASNDLLVVKDGDLDANGELWLTYSVRGDNIKIYVGNRLVISDYVNPEALYLTPDSIIFPVSSYDYAGKISNFIVFDRMIDGTDMMFVQMGSADAVDILDSFIGTPDATTPSGELLSISNVAVRSAAVSATSDLTNATYDFESDRTDLLFAHGETVEFQASGPAKVRIYIESTHGNTDYMSLRLRNLTTDKIISDTAYDPAIETESKWYDIEVPYSGLYELEFYNPRQIPSTEITIRRFVINHPLVGQDTREKARSMMVSFDTPDNTYYDVLRFKRTDLDSRNNGDPAKYQFPDGTYGMYPTGWYSIDTCALAPQTFDQWTLSIRTNAWQETDNPAQDGGIGVFAQHDIMWGVSSEHDIFPRTVGIWRDGVSSDGAFVKDVYKGSLKLNTADRIHTAMGSATKYNERVLISIVYDRGLIRVYVNERCIQETTLPLDQGMMRTQHLSLGVVSSLANINPNLVVQDITAYNWALTVPELLAAASGNAASPVNTLDHQFKGWTKDAKYSDGNDALPELNANRLYSTSTGAGIILNSLDDPDGFSVYPEDIEFETEDREVRLTVLFAKGNTVFTNPNDIKWLVLKDSDGVVLDRVRPTTPNTAHRAVFSPELSRNTRYTLSTEFGDGDINNRASDPAILEWGFDFLTSDAYEAEPLLVGHVTDPHVSMPGTPLEAWNPYAGTPWTESVPIWDQYIRRDIDTLFGYDPDYNGWEHMPEHLNIKMFEYNYLVNGKAAFTHPTLPVPDNVQGTFYVVDQQYQHTLYEIDHEVTTVPGLTEAIFDDKWVLTDKQYPVESLYHHDNIALLYNPFKIHVDTGPIKTGYRDDVPDHLDVKPVFDISGVSFDRVVKAYITDKQSVHTASAVSYVVDDVAPASVDDYLKAEPWARHLVGSVLAEHDKYVPVVGKMIDDDGRRPYVFVADMIPARFEDAADVLAVDSHYYVPDIVKITSTSTITGLPETLKQMHPIQTQEHDPVDGVLVRIDIGNAKVDVVDWPTEALDDIRYGDSIRIVSENGLIEYAPQVLDKVESGIQRYGVMPVVESTVLFRADTFVFDWPVIESDVIPQDGNDLIPTFEKPIPDNYFTKFFDQDPQFQVEIAHPKYYRG
tara:strand:+ start:17486 stop:23896 length:6411 start_codon:yes stop_codon:yes gene_type:complete